MGQKRVIQEEEEEEAGNLKMAKRVSERSSADDVESVKKRCFGCRRKVGLMGFRCRCGDLFCWEHRYSDRHDCHFDYKAAARVIIARDNPVIRPAKILKV